MDVLTSILCRCFPVRSGSIATQMLSPSPRTGPPALLPSRSGGNVRRCLDIDGEVGMDSQVPNGSGFFSFGNSSDHNNNKNSPWSLSLPVAGVFSPFTPRSLLEAPLLDTPQYIATRDAPVNCRVDAGDSTCSASADTTTSASFSRGTPIACDKNYHCGGGISSAAGRGESAPSSSVMAAAPAARSATSAVSSTSSGAGHTQRKVPKKRRTSSHGRGGKKSSKKEAHRENERKKARKAGRAEVDKMPKGERSTSSADSACTSSRPYTFFKCFYSPP
ncbi:unnamed protein product [Sphacelaria rigidula]